MPPETSAPKTPTREPEAAGDTLVLRVNGEVRRLPAPCDVEELLCRLGIDRRRVAVAVNREVVPRSRFVSTRLAGGDRIEILEAVGGG